MSEVLATTYFDQHTPNTLAGLPVHLALAARCDTDNYSPAPPRGIGYIAGEAPDGLVTFNGAPAVRTIDVFDRATNLCVATTTSASDGTYRVDGLDPTREYDVRARGQDEHENDLIAARVTPVT